MKRIFAPLCLFCATSLLAPSSVAANIIAPVTIQTVPVGSQGNTAEPTTGYGAVPYNYSIGAYDVTNTQYVAFLNAKASAADPYGLWNPSMTPGSFEGAIARSGSGPYSFSVKAGYANKPVIYVSLYDAVRFVNWLQNGQGNGDTENGTYTISGGGYNSGDVLGPDVTTRTLWANTNSFHWLLPGQNEWYKAAYYNATSATYYAYPFQQSNSPPAAVAPPGNTNSGNFVEAAFNYDGTGSNLTDVGAYGKSLSPFGSYDMGGDVSQWNDTRIGGGYGVRGGSWGTGPGASAASILGNANGNVPSADFFDVGFRVASVGQVPEPSTAFLAALAFGVIWLGRKRFKPSA
jgi:formylglycine-generating enzyme